MPKPQTQGPAVLRLVPPPLASVSEPQSPPALEFLGEMEAKLSEWLHGTHLQDCESLRGACLEVLNRVNDFLAPHVTEASEGVREFLRMVREAGTSDDPDDGEELGWGAREFLRLVETAEKVVPLRRS
jgi:hypothetical protein